MSFPLTYTKIEGWTSEWPIEKGRYWFYGLRDRVDTIPKLHIVRVWRDTLDRAVYISSDTFLYPDEGARGKWMRLVEPELPTWP